MMAEVAMSPLRSPLRCGSRGERPVASSTSPRGLNRIGSSPPSPLLDFPPMRFMAMASVS